MRLRELQSALPWPRTSTQDVEIAGLASDSRQVEPGYLFVAIKGLEHDGHQFIPEAVARGAVALVVEEGVPFPDVPLPTIAVPDSRRALAYLAAAWHGFPSERLRLIGVTGTDGKTTTCNLIRSIFEAAGHPTGMVTSVEAIIGPERLDTGLHTTTPEALEVQRYLARMVEVGCQYAVLEATSHGLAQARLEACHFDLAVLTNITPEHLDYHRTFQEYQEAKARLFQGLISSKRKEGVPKVSILNLDDPSYERFRGIPADRYLTYGLHEEAQIRAQGLSLSPSGLRFTTQTPDGDSPVESPLVGKFNLWNLLAAIAVGVSQDLPFSAMQEGIQAMSGVVGRMEKVALGQPFSVIIDFAHTPNSLERALETACLLTSGRVISVFGCAGLRDRGKRPVMGEIAGRLADGVVITAEDPRTEPLEAIMAQIAQGCQRAGRREEVDFWRIGDRKEAIRFAIDMAQEGDLVLITGKGHERSMCFGTTEYPWSDHQAVREALKERGYI